MASLRGSRVEQTPAQTEGIGARARLPMERWTGADLGEAEFQPKSSLETRTLLQSRKRVRGRTVPGAASENRRIVRLGRIVVQIKFCGEVSQPQHTGIGMDAAVPELL